MVGRRSGRTVVLPALSRPRKSSLACLLASPSWASISQTVQRYSHQHLSHHAPFHVFPQCASPGLRPRFNVHQSRIHILSSFSVRLVRDIRSVCGSRGAMCESQVKCCDREDRHDSGRLMGARGRRWRCHRARGATSAKQPRRPHCQLVPEPADYWRGAVTERLYQVN